MRWVSNNTVFPLDADFYKLQCTTIGKCSMEKSIEKVLVCGNRRHEFIFESSLEVSVQKGGLNDLISIGVPEIFIVSEKLRSIFEDAKVSGLEYVPATVVPMFPHPSKQLNYWQLVVTGWGGLVPQQTLTWEWEFWGAANELLRRYSGFENNGKFVNPDEWDGSDFFRVWPMPVWTFISKKVAMLLRDKKIKFSQALPLDQFDLPSINDTPVDFGVRPLACYLPPERAREVGERLGIYCWDDKNAIE